MVPVVAGRLDHRNIVGQFIRDIDVFPVRGDGDRIRERPTGTVATTVLVAVSIAETDIGEGRRLRRKGHQAEPHRQHNGEEGRKFLRWCGAASITDIATHSPPIMRPRHQKSELTPGIKSLIRNPRKGSAQFTCAELAGPRTRLCYDL
jgi:hypothetical protein